MRRAGSRTTKVAIQRKASGVDEIGQPLPDNWELLREYYANIKNLRGVESIKAGASVSVVQVSINIDFALDITAGMRVVSGGVIYEIIAPLPDMVRREYTDLVCQVVT